MYVCMYHKKKDDNSQQDQVSHRAGWCVYLMGPMGIVAYKNIPLMHGLSHSIVRLWSLVVVGKIGIVPLSSKRRFFFGFFSQKNKEIYLSESSNLFVVRSQGKKKKLWKKVKRFPSTIIEKEFLHPDQMIPTDRYDNALLT